MSKLRVFSEFISILFCAIVLGAGLGFIQGLLSVISGQKTEITLQFSAWAALIGIGVSIIVVPILYYYLIRNSLSLSAIIEMTALITLIGMFSAYVLGRTLDAGWLSWMVTIVVAVVVAILYCKQGVRIAAE